jgi:hypothetical protein
MRIVRVDSALEDIRDEGFDRARGYTAAAGISFKKKEGKLEKKNQHQTVKPPPNPTSSTTGSHVHSYGTPSLYLSSASVSPSPLSSSWGMEVERPSSSPGPSHSTRYHYTQQRYEGRWPMPVAFGDDRGVLRRGSQQGESSSEWGKERAARR